VQQLAQTFHGQLAFDEPSQSPSLVYANNGQSHVVWYEDSRSFAAKLGLATQQHFAGVGLWRLGQEDPGIWAQWAGAPSPPSTPTPPPAPPTPSPTATPPPAPPSGVCSPIAPFANTPTRVYFPQTGHSLGGGFYQYWLSHGGLAVFGYPLTEEFAERSTTDGQVYTVQYFERNRFEWHPELQGTPYAIQLGLLGAQYTASHISPLTQSHIVPIPGRQFFAETNHNLGGGFLEYWQAHGALAQFGYPISEEISERSATDGQVYTVQYFQRARLEWHPEHSGTPNAIQLGLLGSWALQQRGCTP